MYKVKIATLIYNIYNRATPPCMENLILRRKAKYDLRNQHKIDVSRFDTYYMKNSISHRGSIAWNVLSPSVDKVNHARAYAKMARNSQALRNLNFSAESPQTSVHNDSDFVFY